MLKKGASIITPTRCRERFLPHAYKGLCAQTFTDWEWLVDDDSPIPSSFMTSLSDPRVRYHHDPTSRSVGNKRNDLIERSESDTIVHFDDDDYYAPNYLASMISTMRQANADFIKLSSYYLYSTLTGTVAYWNMHITKGLHFAWDGGDVQPVILTNENNQGFIENYLGYGFSYVYKRSLWGAQRYPDESGPEDGKFLRSVYHGRNLLCVDDQMGICIHVLHGKNLSFCYPQFFLPQFLTKHLFPNAFEFLEAVTHKATELPARPAPEEAVAGAKSLKVFGVYSRDTGSTSTATRSALSSPPAVRTASSNF